ncbi:epoxide hydrolase A-like [Salvia divinorum]|uniref:Epoxide hydrolase A-like n=1 Tax=Salvia divinorum TaxID=28513 RepID=A0ABD1I294_SALDI
MAVTLLAPSKDGYCRLCRAVHRCGFTGALYLVLSVAHHGSFLVLPTSFTVFTWPISFITLSQLIGREASITKQKCSSGNPSGTVIRSWKLCIEARRRSSAVATVATVAAPALSSSSLQPCCRRSIFVVAVVAIAASALPSPPLSPAISVSTASKPGYIEAWLTEKDIDYYVTKFKKTGFTGGVNYCHALALDCELNAPWLGEYCEAVAEFLKRYLYRKGENLMLSPCQSSNFESSSSIGKMQGFNLRTSYNVVDTFYFSTYADKKAALSITHVHTIAVSWLTLS